MLPHFLSFLILFALPSLSYLISLVDFDPLRRWPVMECKQPLLSLLVSCYSFYYSLPFVFTFLMQVINYRTLQNKTQVLNFCTFFSNLDMFDQLMGIYGMLVFITILRQIIL